MNVNSDAYPEVIVKLQNENEYLKSVKREEKEKLENTIKILHSEIEILKDKSSILEKDLKEVKLDNKLLSLEIDKNKNIKEKLHYTI
jgi:predicted  nucleic acid-binding Zn-ribbon protein|tara:strand:+ start:475 stop:735 length:261 start_codon:yes stop_codon:yes gene_type:complete